jgi:hypothetical protein
MDYEFIIGRGVWRHSCVHGGSILTWVLAKRFGKLGNSLIWIEFDQDKYALGYYIRWS